MEALRRLAASFRLRLIPICVLLNCLVTPSASDNTTNGTSVSTTTTSRFMFSSAAAASSSSGWFEKLNLPKIVKAGDPVLHQPAREVDAVEMKSEKVQKIIDDMIRVMRNATGVGLAAPQIGIPLRIIVLENTEEYMSYFTKEEIEAQDSRPFDLLGCDWRERKRKSNFSDLHKVILNPKLKKKSNRTALFFEACLSVNGYGAVLERYLDVEVEGFDRYGETIKINASGWQARILQHECDHLDGILYVDKMTPRTFRSAENTNLPLAHGCPKLGPR